MTGPRSPGEPGRDERGGAGYEPVEDHGHAPGGGTEDDADECADLEAADRGEDADRIRRIGVFRAIAASITATLWTGPSSMPVPRPVTSAGVPGEDGHDGAAAVVLPIPMSPIPMSSTPDVRSRPTTSGRPRWREGLGTGHRRSLGHVRVPARTRAGRGAGTLRLRAAGRNEPATPHVDDRERCTPRRGEDVDRRAAADELASIWAVTSDG